jgi:hypothetical protein
MQLYTKESLIARFQEIAAMGWVPGGRQGNHGSVGNTLEDLLGIPENNLPIPNAAEWELKAQRLGATPLTTLFHTEPSPRAVRFVPTILLPKYGWRHQEAGVRYGPEEMSFRQTINGSTTSDRGFMVKIDRSERKVLISFDASVVDSRHSDWLDQVRQRVGLGELSPQPYWGFDDLEHKAGTKLLNCFYAQASVKLEDGKTFYRYERVMMLQKFDFNGFLKAIEDGFIFVDFDARTGHNHGTKFRLKQNCLPMLYNSSRLIIGEDAPLSVV